MLKHPKQLTHKFGNLKSNNHKIKDLKNCKKCHELNEKHKCTIEKKITT